MEFTTSRTVGDVGALADVAHDPADQGASGPFRTDGTLDAAWQKMFNYTIRTMVERDVVRLRRSDILLRSGL